MVHVQYISAKPLSLACHVFLGCRVLLIPDARATAIEGDGKCLEAQHAPRQYQGSNGIGVVSALECLRQLGLLVEVHTLREIVE